MKNLITITVSAIAAFVAGVYAEKKYGVSGKFDEKVVTPIKEKCGKKQETASEEEEK